MVWLIFAVMVLLVWRTAWVIDQHYRAELAARPAPVPWRQHYGPLSFTPATGVLQAGAQVSASRLLDRPLTGSELDTLVDTYRRLLEVEAIKAKQMRDVAESTERWLFQGGSK